MKQASPFNFSSSNRNESFKNLNDTTFDLVIIGGGITGAGIALDGVCHGFKVALFEMQDFAAGTSSRSTKLIHGGLRYLKNLEFGLVKEVGKERDILFKNAPHLVWPEKLMLPIYKDGSLGRVSTSIALSLYDRLAGVATAERKSMLSKKEALERIPILKEEKLEGAALYTEYQTNDARLVIEVLKTAAQRGAHCFNYARVDGFVKNAEGRIAGVEVKDVLSGQPIIINAHTVVNAAGPWVDQLRWLDRSEANRKLIHTKGVHLVFSQKRFPLSTSLYFDTPDGRMVFAIVRDEKVYCGTTDTFYSEDLKHPPTNTDDVQYLLEAINHIFPDLHLTNSDVESNWSGLRPLLYEEGKSPSQLSRKDELFVSESGLITIAGGKLTAYRKMAQRVVQLVSARLNRTSKGSTKKVRLCGGGLSKKKPQQYAALLAESVQPLAVADVLKLVRAFGSNTPKVLMHYKKIQAESPALSTEQALTIAGWLYCKEEEMAVHMVDYLMRRRTVFHFEPHQLLIQFNAITDYCKRNRLLTDPEISWEKKLLHEAIQSNKIVEKSPTA